MPNVITNQVITYINETNFPSGSVKFNTEDMMVVNSC